MNQQMESHSDNTIIICKWEKALSHYFKRIKLMSTSLYFGAKKVPVLKNPAVYVFLIITLK